MEQTATELLADRPDQLRAVVRGEQLAEMPHDLYIPPDALEVFLETFEGPLDLLLYLIRRQNLDILDIPIAAITAQYMEYVDLMKDLRLELAAEYLVMAAMLAEIKSRMLLPVPVHAEDDEADPRAELVRRLQEYERYKRAAENLDELPRVHRDLYPAGAPAPDAAPERRPPEISMHELLSALADVMARAEMFTHHHVQRESLSVRERMTRTLERLDSENFTDFRDLLNAEEGRAGVVVSFLAILELIKASLIELVQAEPFGVIYVRARA
ncbi:segregation and condensation protein A [Natronocella acetinitrilica]|uniref:Segregation and condensation protein A n=1 Tax=Natronocella acetinitrilica TaxID=414046 RepID=A0AAE3KG39_9GAMM|nr:ScpA family protein [Natronocella acetinitrilica]MCP1674782.1 segregation and condensation protein A [Natronocella acetinitrilica]